MKKQIKINTDGESNTERTFEHLKNWCIENLQEFELEVKGKNEEGEEKIWEHKQKI